MRSFGLGVLIGLWCSIAGADDLEIYIDADYALSSASAESIELGLTTALAEVDFTVANQTITIVPFDHRGNVKRSTRTLQTYLKSDTALAIFGGLHSPPYLENREFINENNILMLLPWSAAGPITRAIPNMDNWIFRLSVDDFQSGEFFIREAIDTGACDAVELLLVDTGWGRANQQSLTTALAGRDMQPVNVHLFPSTIGEAAAGSLARTVAGSGADCAIMVATANGSALIVNELYANGATLRIFSHWGIMGGEFAASVPAATRAAFSLKVLQTCGLRRAAEGSDILTSALMRAGIADAQLSNVAAPTGFVHGYDLGRLLIAAIAQASLTPDWNGDVQAKRQAVKTALEALETPVQGILATHMRPFSPYSEDTRDAHEALGLDDLCMARFSAEGVLENAQQR